MTFEDTLRIAATILASLGGAGVVVIGFSSWLGKIWAERLMNADRAKYSRELEELKARLILDNQKSLESIRARNSEQLEGLKAQLTYSNQLLLESEQAKYNRELEELKAKLDRSNVEFGTENQARKDYEYEARKRLYQQCEPLLFQLVELSENALHRIYSLARTSRRGELGGNRGWLSDTHAYYLASTIYNLLAPLVIYRLIQRRLTLVDLTVDPHINSQYLLAKRLYISFTDDFEFARIEPSIDYDPNTDVLTELAD
jgi:hypothetical protein